MGMAWPRGLSSSWLNVEELACFGFLFLSLWLCALVFSWLNLLMETASGEGRGRLRRALLLLPPLLLFSSLSFASNSISGATSGSSCIPVQQSADQYCISLGTCGGGAISVFTPDVTCADDCDNPPTTVTYTGFSFTACSETCTPSTGEPIGEIGSSLTPNSNGVLPGTYCSPTTYCDTQSYGSGGGGGYMTNGQACFPSTAPTSSTTSASSSCPPGYTVYDASGCICSNGSGSFVGSSSSSTNPACNGGSSTAPTLSPVAPITSSNGQQTCPSGDATISSGSSISCYQQINPPKLNPTSTPGPSSSGGSSTFHTSAPTTSSNGQLVCPPGASTIGNGSTLECIVSGPPSPSSSTSPTASGASSTSPTASGTSGTSATGSTGSGNNFPTSFSMPSMGTASVVVSPLSSIAAVHELTSQTCPQPVTFSVMNHNFSISFTYACQLAAMVRPVVIGVFSMASLLLIVK